MTRTGVVVMNGKLQHTEQAHNVLRTICILELGESVVVLWLFFIQPSHNILQMVKDSCLALENSLRI
jgi:hypothetical protein